ncbi:MAG: GNAT family N-acetyltransferase [Verrucomicrobia bacterium]|nr:GNAT family N-acetyltransferase [Verrucomicrobiota bacterium]
MSLESALDVYPKTVALPGGLNAELRPLAESDEEAFHRFFLEIPAPERLFIKHHVTDRALIRQWCQQIDYDRNLPLLAWANGRVAAAATLHQQHGGWKRHIGRVSVMVHPDFRSRGLARALISELIHLAASAGLEKMEAEFISRQEGAMKVFALLGFSVLLRLPDYVKDLQAVSHDYIVMGLDLLTDEEYAGMG